MFQNWKVEMTAIQLPSPNGLESYRLGPPVDYQAPQVSLNRIAFAAAHVVADPLSLLILGQKLLLIGMRL